MKKLLIMLAVLMLPCSAYAELKHPNMKAVYQLNGSSAEFSGFGPTGVDSNMTYTTNAKFGQSANFNGTSSVITVGTVTTFSFINSPGTFTIAAWVKRKATGFNGFFLCSTTDVRHKGFCFGTSLVNADDLAFVMTPNGIGSWLTRIYTTTNTMTDTTSWHHVAVTMIYNDNTNTKLFIDGVEISSTKAWNTPDSANNSAATTLGHAAYSVSPFHYYGNLLIDDLQVYNIALPPSDIKRIMYGLHPLNK